MTFPRRFGVEFESFGQSFLERPPPPADGAITFADVLAAADWRYLLDANEQTENDGDPIGTAVDQTGAGNDFTAAGAARPILRTTGLGGAAAFEFDGTNHVMAPGFGASPMAQKWAQIFVLEKSAQANSYTSAWVGGAFSGGPCVLSGWSSVDLDYFGRDRPSGPNQFRQIAEPAAAGPHIIVAYSDGATGDLIVRYDGSEVINISTEFDWSTAGSGPVRFGAGPTAANKWNGDIAVWGVIDEQLSAGQLATLEGYYAALYGITLA